MVSALSLLAAPGSTTYGADRGDGVGIRATFVPRILDVCMYCIFLACYLFFIVYVLSNISSCSYCCLLNVPDFR